MSKCKFKPFTMAMLFGAGAFFSTTSVYAQTQVTDDLSLRNAMANPSVSEIIVMNDITMTDVITISSARTVALSANNSTPDVSITSAMGKRHFIIEDAGSVLTLTDGIVLQGHGSETIAGGVVAQSGGTFTMNGGVITGNAAYQGGGVLVGGGSGASFFNMTGGTISNNAAEGDGGGLHATWGGRVHITNGTFTNNTASGGGGLWLCYGTESVIENILVNDNGYDWGGDIVVYGWLDMQGGLIDGEVCVVWTSADDTTYAIAPGAIKVEYDYDAIYITFPDNTIICLDFSDPNEVFIFDITDENDPELLSIKEYGDYFYIIDPIPTIAPEAVLVTKITVNGDNAELTLNDLAINPLLRTAGYDYVISVSTDLANWTTYTGPRIESRSTSPHRITVPDAATIPTRFFKVQAVQR